MLCVVRVDLLLSVEPLNQKQIHIERFLGKDLEIKNDDDWMKLDLKAFTFLTCVDWTPLEKWFSVHMALYYIRSPQFNLSSQGSRSH